MKLTKEEKIQLVCAALQGATQAMPEEIKTDPSKIAHSAVTIGALAARELEKRAKEVFEA